MDAERDYEHDDSVIIRTLRPQDLDRLVRIDQQYVARPRARYLEGKLARALGADVQVSLGAEVDGTLVGAVLGVVHYGEFGMAEPVAVLDTLLVDKAFAGQGIGKRMLDQLMLNLAALRIERVRTEVGWTEQDLIRFLSKAGFEPVPRLVLERRV